METFEREEAFAKHLLEHSLISDALLTQAQTVSHELKDALVWTLSKLGFVPENRLADALAEFMKVPRLLGPFEADIPDGLSPEFLKFHGLIPIKLPGGESAQALSNPLEDTGLQGIEFATGIRANPMICTLSDVQAALASRFPEEAESKALRFEQGHASESLLDLASDAPTIRLVQRIVTMAVDQRASDIHLEPTESSLKVRFRSDGVLNDVESFPIARSSSIVSRVKVMAKLNIAERRLPQDGRLHITVNGKGIDFRVATSPTLHGESVVLRILDRQEVELDFARLGFDAALIETMRTALHKPYGIILSTGPTGSGKTTTLYTALKSLNTPERKILTVEDPIEYTLEGVNQTQVRPQIGYSFSSALRAFLRQDPDVLMVGEIRDRETAEIAVQAALTGHLLLSTLHTNSASAAVTRLLDMGIDDFLLTSTLNLVIGQRLVRRLCEQCRESYCPGTEVIRRYQLDKKSITTPRLFSPRGCSHCHDGYQGRRGLLELLELNEPIRRSILARDDAFAIESKAASLGMRTLFQHGLDLALAGQTTLEEVVRVTRASD